MSGVAQRRENLFAGDGPSDGIPALAAFIQDDATRASLAAIAGSTWDATILPGGIEDAIDQLWNGTPPRYLVVDLTGVADPFSAIDRLAEVCAPGTLLLAIGDTNDITFYRGLRDAGVADYLVKPVNPDALAAALRALRISAAPPKRADSDADKGQIIAVVGSRGGVGVSTLATTLAWQLAKADQLTTMLVDLDMNSGTAALAFDVEPGRGLSEALERPDRIDALLISTAATPISDQLTLLCAEEPFDSDAALQPGAIKRLANELRQLAERIIIDVPRGRTELLREALSVANVAIIVTDLSLAGLRDATRLRTFLRGHAGDCKILVVANRVGRGGKGALARGDFEKALGVTLSALIPDDGAAVAHAVNTGRPLPVGAPASKATQAIVALARNFRAESAAPKSLLGKLFRRTRQPVR